jgi:hypothetical protein
VRPLGIQVRNRCAKGLVPLPTSPPTALLGGCAIAEIVVAQ